MAMSQKAMCGAHHRLIHNTPELPITWHEGGWLERKDPLEKERRNASVWPQGLQRSLQKVGDT